MKNILTTISLILGITIALSAAIFPAYALDAASSPSLSIEGAEFSIKDYLKLPDNQQPTAYFNDPQYGPATAFILYIINFALRIFGTLAILMFILAGFMFIFAQGNQQRIDNAKEVIKYAIIGLIATFLAYLIIIFVQSLFITGELPPQTK